MHPFPSKLVREGRPPSFCWMYAEALWPIQLNLPWCLGFGHLINTEPYVTFWLNGKSACPDEVSVSKTFDDDSGAIRCDPGEGLLLLLLVFPVLLLLPFFAAGRPVRTVCATPGAAPSFWRPSHRPGAEGQHRDSSCARRWGNNEASGDLDCRMGRHSAFRIQPSHEIFTGIKMQWVGLSVQNQFGTSLMQVSLNFLSSIGSPFRCRWLLRKKTIVCS